MKLKRKEVELVKAIVSDKPDLFHCGFSGHKPGAYLAIPQTFFTQPNQIQITSLVRIFNGVSHIFINLSRKINCSHYNLSA